MKFINLLKTQIKSNSPLILSVTAGVGVISTSYLASRATYKMANDPEFDPNASNKDKIKKYGRLYIPAGLSAAATVGCLVGANRVGMKKLVAAQTTLAVAERATSEYREKVVEQIGERKEKTVRDKIAEDRVKNTPPPPQNVLMSGPGAVLCCEMHTMRYFTADMETLKKAENELNANMLKRDYQTLNDFYYLVDLQQTTTSGNLGWTSDKLLELNFSPIMTEDGRPCIAFEYNYVTPL